MNNIAKSSPILLPIFPHSIDYYIFNKTNFQSIILYVKLSNEWKSDHRSDIGFEFAIFRNSWAAKHNSENAFWFISDEEMQYFNTNINMMDEYKKLKVNSDCNLEKEIKFKEVELKEGA